MKTVLIVLGGVLIASLAIGTVVSSRARDGGSGDTAAPESSISTTATTTSAPPAPGTRENPVPLGSPAPVGDGWTVSVIGVDFDAAAAVQAAYAFNDPPAPGRFLVMPSVSVSYDGARSQASPLELTITAIGQSNAEYAGFGLDESCGIIPDDLHQTGDLLPGGTGSGNVCWAVDGADIDTLVMAVEPALAFGGDVTYLALR